MALTDHEEFTFSVVTYDDPFGFPTVGGAIASTVDYTEDGLLSPSLHSSASQTSEIYSPSSESILSFNSNAESPLWYSPESPYQLSPTSSPYSTKSAELEPTVYPRDITTSPYAFGYCDFPTHQAESIEPLFEESAEDTASRELRAIDGIDPRSTISSTLFGAMTGLHISIPHAPTSPCPTETATQFSAEIQCDESEHPGQGISGSYSQYPGSPTADSLLSPSPSPSTNSEGPSRRRRPSHAGSTRTSSRHSPYRQPSTSPVANKDNFGQENEEDMTQESFELIKEILIQHKKFKTFNFDGGDLPPLLKVIVGSDQTRKASQVRRTDSSVFSCPILNCGATLTKRHNLKHHIESHFVEPNYPCKHCSSHMRHHASLKRHELGCEKKKATLERSPVSKGKKRGKN